MAQFVSYRAARFRAQHDHEAVAKLTFCLGRCVHYGAPKKVACGQSLLPGALAAIIRRWITEEVLRNPWLSTLLGVGPEHDKSHLAQRSWGMRVAQRPYEFLHAWLRHVSPVQTESSSRLLWPCCSRAKKNCVVCALRARDT